MLDIKYIKENPEEVIARLAKKGKDARAEIEEILKLDGERRALIAGNEAMKAEANKTNKLIPQYKREGKDVAALFAEMKELSAIVLEMLASLNAMDKKKERLIEITADGQISSDEIDDFIRIRQELERISVTVETLQLWTERMLANGQIDAEAYKAKLSQP